MSKHILIVDDEPLNRDIICRYLEDGDYTMDTAENGEDALQKIKSNTGDQFDLIVLDKMMPNMDGIELLTILKADEAYRDIPVIMQSAATDKEHVMAGINAGAYYYLTKPYDEDVLLTIIKSALKDADKAEMHKNTINHGDVPKIVTDLNFKFQTIYDAELAADFFINLSDAHNIKFGLREILVNAVEHGNLMITYDEKSVLNREGKLQDEVEARLELPENQDKYVTLHFTNVGGLLTFYITDAGEGFDWQEYMTLSPERAFDSHGRGIAFAGMKCFDSIEYIGKGNEVKCIIDLNAKKD